jgi:hypothetical protein
VVDVAVVAAIAWRAAAPPFGGLVALAILAAVGVTASFLVVFSWTVRRGDAAMASGAEHPLMAVANRDGFYLALWGAVLAGRPALLLWLLAVGANVFWVLWLAMAPAHRARGRG